MCVCWMVIQMDVKFNAIIQCEFQDQVAIAFDVEHIGCRTSGIMKDILSLMSFFEASSPNDSWVPKKMTTAVFLGIETMPAG